MFDVCLLFSTKPSRTSCEKKILKEIEHGDIMSNVLAILFPQTIKANDFSLSKVQGPP
jgi:hypothetical protein